MDLDLDLDHISYRGGGIVGSGKWGKGGHLLRVFSPFSSIFSVKPGYINRLSFLLWPVSTPGGDEWGGGACVHMEWHFFLLPF